MFLVVFGPHIGLMKPMGPVPLSAGVASLASVARPKPKSLQVTDGQPCLTKATSQIEPQAPILGFRNSALPSYGPGPPTSRTIGPVVDVLVVGRPPVHRTNTSWAWLHAGLMSCLQVCMVLAVLGEQLGLWKEMGPVPARAPFA